MPGQVASFTDAWIETSTSRHKSFRSHTSHLLQMRGLKQVQAGTRALEAIRRIFYRCVD